jgi:hypothetical protein
MQSVSDHGLALWVIDGIKKNKSCIYFTCFRRDSFWEKLDLGNFSSNFSGWSGQRRPAGLQCGRESGTT